MTNTHILESVEKYVKSTLKNDYSGHDWDHIDRVHRMSIHIAQREPNANMFIVEMSALLHDVIDEKLNTNVEEASSLLQQFLYSIGVSKAQVQAIFAVIQSISFKGGNEQEISSIEAAIVRDADRLDAIGAIGVARAFSYGATKKRRMYDSSAAIRKSMTIAEYRNNEGNTIQHFYEKLLKLKDNMLTVKGKELAAERHIFLQQFLEQFLKEWNV